MEPSRPNTVQPRVSGVSPSGAIAILVISLAVLTLATLGPRLSQNQTQSLEPRASQARESVDVANADAVIAAPEPETLVLAEQQIRVIMAANEEVTEVAIADDLLLGAADGPIRGQLLGNLFIHYREDEKPYEFTQELTVQNLDSETLSMITIFVEVQGATE